MSLDFSSDTSLFGSEKKTNFKAVLSVSVSMWKISTFSITIIFCKCQ